MTRKTIATIAGAFAAGVFVAAAPTVLGHGPGVDVAWPSHHAAGHTEAGCDAAMTLDLADHMTDHDTGWMADMMSGLGVER